MGSLRGLREAGIWSICHRALARWFSLAGAPDRKHHHEVGEITLTIAIDIGCGATKAREDQDDIPKINRPVGVKIFGAAWTGGEHFNFIGTRQPNAVGDLQLDAVPIVFDTAPQRAQHGLGALKVDPWFGVGVVVVVQDGSPAPISGPHITIVILHFPEQVQDGVVDQAVGGPFLDAGDLGFWGGSVKANQNGGLVLIAFHIGDGQGDHARCGVGGLLVAERMGGVGGGAGGAITKIPKPLQHGAIGIDGRFSNKFDREW